jgi:hypothetical protein
MNLFKRPYGVWSANRNFSVTEILLLLLLLLLLLALA